MTPTVATFVQDLSALGVMFVVDGDRLRFRPQSLVTPDLLAAIRSCKADIIAHLRSADALTVDTTQPEPEEKRGSVFCQRVDARQNEVFSWDDEQSDHA